MNWIQKLKNKVKQTINQTKTKTTMSETKKYIAPCDMYDGQISKGTIMVADENGNYYPEGTEGTCSLPKEIVETWESYGLPTLHGYQGTYNKENDTVTYQGQSFAGEDMVILCEHLNKFPAIEGIQANKVLFPMADLCAIASFVKSNRTAATAAVLRNYPTNQIQTLVP